MNFSAFVNSTMNYSFMYVEEHTSSHFCYHLTIQVDDSLYSQPINMTVHCTCMRTMNCKGEHYKTNNSIFNETMMLMMMNSNYTRHYYNFDYKHSSVG